MIFSLSILPILSKGENNMLLCPVCNRPIKEDNYKLCSRQTGFDLCIGKKVGPSFAETTKIIDKVTVGICQNCGHVELRIDPTKLD